MVYCDSDFSEIEKDTIFLETKDPIEKLAISYALAQSVKLTSCEIQVDKTI